MKRLLAGTALAAVVAVTVALVAGAGGGGDPYRVRAIFDGAANVIPGEDVKIAGAKVGSVDSLDVTPQEKAVVVLNIANAGFRDFRVDASCTIRPQSLIGEKFVECVPTQPRAPGAALPSPLAVVPSGHPGAGQHLLPVTQTSSPVDLDLVGDIMRLPYRQRLTILVNELGAGLAGRGQDLRAVIARADPALAQTDRLLAELAVENRTLASLASQSDAVLAPLARSRAQVADAIVQTNAVSQATAEHAAALQRNIADLPAFLRQLQPTMARLGQLADQTTPALANLDRAAPAIDRATQQLAPFSRAGVPFFQTLGQTARAGTPAVVAAKPLVDNLGALGAQSKPFGTDLAALLTSVQKTGGIERLMDFAFLGASATNGFDTLGHYLRAALVVNPCSTYAVTPFAGCNANFIKGAKASGASAAKAAPADPTLQRTAAVLRGKAAQARKQHPVPGAPRPAPAPTAGAQQLLLNYLLGG
jgi:ABC-type transporter Mla subunit MlaD